MAIDRKVRSDHKRGTEDAKRGFFERAVTDLTGQHPGTKAYYDGRKGKPIDADKKRK